MELTSENNKKCRDGINGIDKLQSPQEEQVLEYGNKTYNRSDVSDMGEGNLYGDPLFLETAWGREGDYYLNTGSPAIDADNSATAPAIDLDGRIRPDGNDADMGCYEK